MMMMIYLGLGPAIFLCANQHEESLDLQVAWHCAVCHVAPSDFGALFPFLLIVKSGALPVSLVVGVVL
jgi:hypothetical protein